VGGWSELHELAVVAERAELDDDVIERGVESWLGWEPRDADLALVGAATARLIVGDDAKLQSGFARSSVSDSPRMASSVAVCTSTSSNNPELSRKPSSSMRWAFTNSWR
jgi:hypothetical protein